jgi:epoxyqueuosine reductase QueG
MNKEMSKELAKYADSIGIDLLGIAPIGRFDDLPPERHPASVFPEVKSVIVVGKRIVRGALRGTEEGTQFQSYLMYGYHWLDDRFLSITTFKLTEFLEDRRYEAVPMMNLPVEIPPMGVPVRSGQPAPNVIIDFDDAAVRAGLGEIGYLGIFLSPEFGPRQRFYIILTDAVLEPTPICEKEICKRTSDYAKLCPLDAIDPSREQTLSICGKEMKTASIDYAKCAKCKNGATANHRFPGAKPDRLAALCVRSYMNLLEKDGRIGNKFEHPFRNRPAWKLVEDRVVIQEGHDIE